MKINSGWSLTRKTLQNDFIFSDLHDICYRHMLSDRLKDSQTTGRVVYRRTCAVAEVDIPLLAWCNRVSRVVCKYWRTAVAQLVATTGSVRTFSWRCKSAEPTTYWLLHLRCSYARQSSVTCRCAQCRLLASPRSQRSRCRTSSRPTCTSVRLAIQLLHAHRRQQKTSAHLYQGQIVNKNCRILQRWNAYGDNNGNDRQ